MEYPRGHAGSTGMTYGTVIAGNVGRVVLCGAPYLPAINPPERLARRMRSSPATTLAKLVLVRGRGLARRRPRGLLRSLLAAFGLAVLLLALLV